MKNLPLCVTRGLTFAVAFALFFCSIFVLAAEVHAKYILHDDAAPHIEPAPNRSVRRAPIRRAPQRAPARAQNQQNRQRVEQPPQPPPPPPPPQPSSLETGIRMMEEMRFKQARDWLLKAVQEERDNPYAWYWYGKAHDRLGQFSQAQFFFRRALELDPAFPPFARVVAYPNDGNRIALWDPLRPARVYPVELRSSGITIVPPGAEGATRRPVMPQFDTGLPIVPVYIPPDFPAAVPDDMVRQPVYVPPGFTGQQPVYIPPPPPR